MAIELAAAWVHHWPLGEIAEQLKSLLLEAGYSTIDRHQSIHASFEHSWKLLIHDEQRALGALSVFEGGFDKDMALAVCNVQSSTLVSLINKSLLMVAAGRYSFHPLIHENARHKCLMPEKNELEAQHAEFFLNYLCLQEDPLLGGPSVRETHEALTREIPNLRKAWSWGVTHGLHVELLKGLWVLVIYCELTTNAQLVVELCQLLEANQELLQRSRKLHGAVIAAKAFAYIRFGKTALVTELLPVADHYLNEISDLDTQAFYWVNLNNKVGFYSYAGDAGKCHEFCQESLRLTKALCNAYPQSEKKIDIMHAISFDLIAFYHLFFGSSYELMAEYLQKGLPLHQKHQSPFATYTQARLAEANLHLKGPEVALRDIEQAVKACRDLDYKVGHSWSLTMLVRVLLELKRYKEAEVFLHETREVLAFSDDKTVTIQWYLVEGNLAYAQNQTKIAVDWYLQSLHTMQQVSGYLFGLPALLMLAHIYLDSNRCEEALEILSYLCSNPMTPQPLLEKANVLLEKIKPRVSEQDYDAVLARGKSIELETLMEKASLLKR